MKKMLSVVSGMALVAALGTPAFAGPDEVEVNAAGLAAASPIAQDDSTSTLTNTNENTTKVNDSFKAIQSQETNNTTTTKTENETKLGIEDSFKVQESFNTKNEAEAYTWTKTETDQSINDSFKVSDSGNTDTDVDASVNDSGNTETEVKVSDSFKQDNSTKTVTNTTTTATASTDNSQDNDGNVIVEASLVMVSANVALPGVPVNGLGGTEETYNKIEVRNAANDFSGISNINLSSGYFNNAASQVTFGISK